MCSPSILTVEAGGLGAEGYLWLHERFEVSLGYRRPYLKTAIEPATAACGASYGFSSGRRPELDPRSLGTDLCWRFSWKGAQIGSLWRSTVPVKDNKFSPSVEFLGQKSLDLAQPRVTEL